MCGRGRAAGGACPHWDGFDLRRGGGEPGRQCACHQLEHRSHWKRRGPACWCPAPSPHWWHGAWTSSSSSSASCTCCRTSIAEVRKPARRCFWSSRYGRTSGAQWTRYCRNMRWCRRRFRPRRGCSPSARGCCRVAEMWSIVENSPGRSEPLMGGATTLMEAAVRPRRRLTGLEGGCLGEGGCRGGWSVGGCVERGLRKGSRDICWGIPVG